MGTPPRHANQPASSPPSARTSQTAPDSSGTGMWLATTGRVWQKLRKNREAPLARLLDPFSPSEGATTATPDPH